MSRRQFRILFREFLFRMVDLELLAPQGDITRLLGQFAALLLFVSSVFGLGGLFFSAGRMKPLVLMVVLWNMEHFLISTTMLVVGVFAVLSWDSAFPDRRDVVVLSPLPVPQRTLFLAKVAALGTALALTVASVNAIMGLLWPLHFPEPGSGLVGLVRSLTAYWITVTAAGAFVFCSVLGLHGLAAQLPRSRFLRVSAVLQMGAFALFVCVYFLEPQLATPPALAAPGNQRALAWLPTYWFWGLFQSLNGSQHPAMPMLAWRACVGLLMAGTVSGVSFLLAYYRTLRKIVEEPDILPGSRTRGWMPRFGKPFETAVVRFTIRTLFRSRQHRVILAAYLGLALALVTFYLRRMGVHDRLRETVSAPLIVASAMTLCLCIAGMRAVFSLPLDLRANWIFRVIPLPVGVRCLSPVRRAMWLLAIAPFWIGSAAAAFVLWPWRAAAVHLAVLGLTGLALVDAALYGFRKIPFTCSYLPGKSQAHMVFLSGLGLLLVVSWLADVEMLELSAPTGPARMLALLAAIAAGARWYGRRAAKAADEVQFDEELPPVIVSLDIGPSFRNAAPEAQRSTR